MTADVLMSVDWSMAGFLGAGRKKVVVWVLGIWVVEVRLGDSYKGYCSE